MSITTYDELLEAVTRWADRADLTADAADFIDLAQAKIHRKLNLMQWEQRAYTTTIAGEAYIERPPRSNGIRSIYLNTSPKQPLEYKKPEVLNGLWAVSQSGKPLMFTMVGNEIQVAPVPDAEYELEVSYILRPQFVGPGVQTNWVIENCPDLLLYGSLLELAPFIKDLEMIQVWNAGYESVLNEVIEQDLEIQYPSGKTMAAEVI